MGPYLRLAGLPLCIPSFAASCLGPRPKRSGRPLGPAASCHFLVRFCLPQWCFCGVTSMIGQSSSGR